MHTHLPDTGDLHHAVTVAETELRGLSELVRWRRAVAAAATAVTTLIPLAIAFGGRPWPHAIIAGAIVFGYLALAGGIAVAQLDYVVERQRDCVRAATEQVADQLACIPQLPSGTPASS